MYEQNTPIIRRLTLIIIGFVVLVLLVWFVLWLIFFRHPVNPAEDTGNKATTQQTQKNSDTSRDSSTKSSSDKATSTNSSSSNTQATTTPSTPSELANTGAGDVVTPVVIASIVGASGYYVRLRRKLSA